MSERNPDKPMTAAEIEETIARMGAQVVHSNETLSPDDIKKAYTALTQLRAECTKLAKHPVSEWQLSPVSGAPELLIHHTVCQCSSCQLHRVVMASKSGSLIVELQKAAAASVGRPV